MLNILTTFGFKALIIPSLLQQHVSYRFKSTAETILKINYVGSRVRNKKLATFLITPGTVSNRVFPNLYLVRTKSHQ